jgi:hypothetical protein
MFTDPAPTDRTAAEGRRCGVSRASAPGVPAVAQSTYVTPRGIPTESFTVTALNS